MRTLFAVILTFILLGCVSMTPSTRYVQVEFSLPGLSPEDVEKRIALTVENAVVSWPDVQILRSRSSPERYALDVELKLQASGDFANRLIAEVMKTADGAGILIGAHRTCHTNRSEFELSRVQHPFCGVQK
jgi:multidrug efflux pump subunit AcrB